ncbi:hypothetical protein ABK040_006356 [Willaertia magna]
MFNNDPNISNTITSLDSNNINLEEEYHALLYEKQCVLPFQQILPRCIQLLDERIQFIYETIQNKQKSTKVIQQAPILYNLSHNNNMNNNNLTAAVVASSTSTNNNNATVVSNNNNNTPTTNAYLIILTTTTALTTTPSLTTSDSTTPTHSSSSPSSTSPPLGLNLSSSTQLPIQQQQVQDNITSSNSNATTTTNNPLESNVIQPIVANVATSTSTSNQQGYSTIRHENLEIKQKLINAYTVLLFIPQELFPDYNFVGRILGPKGSFLDYIRRQSNCFIRIRGKGLNTATAANNNNVVVGNTKQQQEWLNGNDMDSSNSGGGSGTNGNDNSFSCENLHIFIEGKGHHITTRKKNLAKGISMMVPLLVPQEYDKDILKRWQLEQWRNEKKQNGGSDVGIPSFLLGGGIGNNGSSTSSNSSNEKTAFDDVEEEWNRLLNEHDMAMNEMNKNSNNNNNTVRFHPYQRTHP